MTRKAMFFLIIILFITFMVMWYITANQFYVKNNVSNFKINGMCSKIISLVWSDTADCCLSYDEVYGYGGNKDLRKKTDYELKKCALDHGINKKTATVLYYVTRVLGSPYVDTSWRWGYAYDFGAGYEVNR